MSWPWLKSAIRAAKKKNKLTENVLLLVGNELEVAEQQKNKTTSGRRVNRELVEKPPQKVRVEKTPSLKDTLSKISSIGKDEKQADNKATQSTNAQNEAQVKSRLTQEELTTQYEVFLDKIKKDQPRLHSAMKSQGAILNDSGVVELYFQNNAQLEEFKQRLKPSFISHIRNAVGIQELDVEELVIETEKLAKPKLFSDNERFKQLSDKNPALLTLKNLFKLDFE